jgi:hypothetical protein
MRISNPIIPPNNINQKMVDEKKFNVTGEQELTVMLRVP